MLIFSTIFIYLNGDSIKFDRGNIKSLVLRGSINSIGATFGVFALKLIRVSTFELLLRMGNVAGVFIGYFTLGEIVTRYDLYSLFSSFFGIVLILKPSVLFEQDALEAVDPPFGVILGCITGSFLAFGTVFSRKLLKTFHEIYMLFGMGFMQLIVGVIGNQINSISISIDLDVILGLSLLSILEFWGFFLSFKALHYEPISKLAPFYFSRIIYSVIITYFLYNSIDALDLLGVFLITAVYTYISYKKIHDSKNIENKPCCE